VGTVVELRNGEASSRVRKSPQSPVNNLKNEEGQYRAKAKRGPQVRKHADLHVCLQSVLRFRILIRIGSGFNQAGGFGIQIRNQECKKKNRKSLEISCFEVMDVFLRAEGFSCSLDVI
jgi:hypothetical protein